jgi:hypothetical protein
VEKHIPSEIEPAAQHEFGDPANEEIINQRLHAMRELGDNSGNPVEVDTEYGIAKGHIFHRSDSGSYIFAQETDTEHGRLGFSLPVKVQPSQVRALHIAINDKK